MAGMGCYNYWIRGLLSLFSRSAVFIDLKTEVANTQDL